MMMTRQLFCGVTFVALCVSVMCLLAVPSVARADTIANWYITGTESWSDTSGGTSDGLRTVTNDMHVGSFSSGVLNQTGGTITENTNWSLIVGQQATGTYNMSGAASLNTTGGTSAEVMIGNNATGTWTLTDDATATVGNVNFRDANASLLLLSGNASVIAADLINFFSADYISFDSGSTATLTVASKSLSDYQTLVSGGFIRVDGVTQSDFSEFQVTGNTLSLVPEPSTLTIAALGLLALGFYGWRRRHAA